MQTAEIVGEVVPGTPSWPTPRLRERSLGHWEGLTRDEVAARYPDEYADWVAGRDVSRRGGETREQVAERALAAFAELPDVAITVLVTHSATAMALTNALLGHRRRPCTRSARWPTATGPSCYAEAATTAAPRLAAARAQPRRARAGRPAAGRRRAADDDASDADA